MIIDHSTIMYFSGTGNSLYVAKKLNVVLKTSKLYAISSLNEEENIEIKGYVLGIVFPVYYARLPLIVESVVKKLIISENTYVFAIATHGGAPSDVLNKLELILNQRENRLDSSFLLKMPGNNIFAYGAGSITSQNKIIKKSDEKLKIISHKLLSKENLRPEKSNLMIDILIDKAFNKTTDKIMKGLHKSDEKFWVTEDCTLCKICSKVCPVSNIEISDSKPLWKNRCERCTACIQYCPSNSIRWGDKTASRRRYSNPNVNVKDLYIHG